MSLKIILYAEDHIAINKLWTSMLGARGYQVYSAYGAEGAINLAEDLIGSGERIGLILTDYQMPGKQTGVDLLRDLRTMGVDAPAILVTGNPGLLREGEADAFDAVMAKPLDMKDLFNLIQKLFS